MKMHINIIMSAERPARTPAQDLENARRTNELHRWLSDRGISFLPARGSYKGVEERSVVILVEDSADYDAVLFHAELLGQESVLVIDRNGVARLVYMAGGIERVGIMEKVTERVARSRPGWTRVKEAGRQEFSWYSLNHEEAPRVEAVNEAEAERLGLPQLH